MVLTSEEQKNLRMLPVIRRARDFHLYDASGRRFLDLYLDGGRAWLGHRPDGVSLQFKNSLSRGVSAPYPSSEEGKMLKAARALSRTAGAPISDGESLELNAAWYAPGSQAPAGAGYGEAADMLTSTSAELSQASLVLWRPGLSWPASARAVEILVPLPGFESGRIIISSRELPAGDLPPAVLAAAVSRALWSLNRALEKRAESTSGSGDSTGMDHRSLLPGSWKSISCYYFWDGNAEDYNELFTKALEAGVLLPPSPRFPCIISGELTSGDLAALKKLL